MRLRSAVTLVALSLGVAPASASPPELNLVYYESAAYPNIETFYYIYLPEGYRDSTTSFYPMMIFFVGSGEVGTDPAKLTVNGPLKTIKANANRAPTGFGMDQFIFVVNSQPYDGSTHMGLAKEVYDLVVSGYRVNPARVSVTGISMGGNGAHTFAITYPQLVSAVIPVSAANMRDPIPTNACSLYATSVPIWILHGAEDNVGWGISVANSTALYNTINACVPLVHPARYTLVDGFAHSSTLWNDIYSNRGAGAGIWTLVTPGLDALNSGGYLSIYDWAAAQAGGASPTNRAPEFEPVGPQSVDAGDSLTLDAMATDPEGNDIILTAVGLPPFASFTDLGGGHGRLTLSPSIAEVGVFAARLRAADTGGASTDLVISITVIPPDDGSINLALLKPVTVSSTLNQTYVGPNAVDGVISDASRWVSDASPTPHTLVVDLLGTYEVRRAIIYTGFGVGYALADADLEYDDGTGWTLVPGCSVRGNTLDRQVVPCRADPPVIADRLRLVAYDSGYVRIRELEAFGIPAPSADGAGGPDGSPAGGDPMPGGDDQTWDADDADANGDAATAGGDAVGSSGDGATSDNDGGPGSMPALMPNGCAGCNSSAAMAPGWWGLLAALLGLRRVRRPAVPAGASRRTGSLDHERRPPR